MSKKITRVFLLKIVQSPRNSLPKLANSTKTLICCVIMEKKKSFYAHKGFVPLCIYKTSNLTLSTENLNQDPVTVSGSGGEKKDVGICKL